MRLVITVVLTLLIFSSKLLSYYSQCGQDQFINEQVFPKLQGGTFVEVGAHNGIAFSNTFFFEKERGWKGICVEPIPDVFEQLEKNRNCSCYQGCVTNFTGRAKFLRVHGYSEMLSGLLDKYDDRGIQRIISEIESFGGSYEIIDVDCYLLSDLLNKHEIKHIHYLSLDTEGGEYDILTSIDFSKYQIDIISVEDNYGDKRIKKFLRKKGFVFIKKLNQDLIFRNKKLKL